MSNIDTAVKALCHVRDRMGLHASDNKRIGDHDPGTEAGFRNRLAANQRQHAVGQIRSNKHVPGMAGHSKKNITKYGEAVLAAGAGNCVELSCAVASYLGRGWGAPGWDLVNLAGGSDHIFVAIAPPDPGGDGAYPTSFAEWPEDCAIVDAWADIACSARTFPENWRHRIANWGRIGMQLPRINGQGFGDAAGWRDAVTEAKVSYTAT